MTNKEEQKFEFKNITEGLRSIYKYTRDFKKSIVFILFLIIISSAIEAFIPYIWGLTVDAVISKESIMFGSIVIKQAYFILGIFVILLIIQLVVDLKRSLKARWIEENVRISFLEKSFGHIFKLPLGYHKSAKQGETDERIRTAGHAINTLFTRALLESLPQIITALIMCIIVTTINVLFGAIIFIALFIFIYISIKEIAPTFSLQKQSSRGYRKAGGMVQDAMTNIRSVKDFNTEEYELARISRTHQEEGFKMWYKSFTIMRRTNSIQGFIKIITRTIITVSAFVLIFNNEMTLGQLIALISYVGLIFSPLSQIFSNWRDIQNGIVSINEAEKIMEVNTENYTPSETNSIIEGSVSLKDVSFYYDETNPVLKKINVNILKGQNVALVGESGVGKSTLIDLLLGYHFAQEGSVMMDGINIKEINLTILRQNIAVVSQEISLFNDTIKNNIAYGSFDKTDEEIKEAARKAHCIDFIEKFPEKWNQVVGEKGLKLSVGQKQRVAIARAILKDPKILILDEPTSALDAGSEQIITESFRELMRGRTTFIIAHRLSTVREADVILVFKSGEIVERGKHTELITIEGGEYRRLYELQIGLHS